MRDYTLLFQIFLDNQENSHQLNSIDKVDDAYVGYDIDGNIIVTEKDVEFLEITDGAYGNWSDFNRFVLYESDLFKAVIDFAAQYPNVSHWLHMCLVLFSDEDISTDDSKLKHSFTQLLMSIAMTGKSLLTPSNVAQWNEAVSLYYLPTWLIFR